MLHVEKELLTLVMHLTSFLVFSGVCVARSLVFCVVLCRSLFLICSLCCLSFNLPLFNTPMVSSNFFLEDPLG